MHEYVFHIHVHVMYMCIMLIICIMYMCVTCIIMCASHNYYDNASHNNYVRHMYCIHVCHMHAVSFASHVHVVIDVYSAWCGPCKAVQGLFRRLKNELGDDLLRFGMVTLPMMSSKCKDVVYLCCRLNLTPLIPCRITEKSPCLHSSCLQ